MLSCLKAKGKKDVCIENTIYSKNEYGNMFCCATTLIFTRWNLNDMSDSVFLSLKEAEFPTIKEKNISIVAEIGTKFFPLA